MEAAAAQCVVACARVDKITRQQQSEGTLRQSAGSGTSLGRRPRARFRIAIKQELKRRQLETMSLVCDPVDKLREFAKDCEQNELRIIKTTLRHQEGCCSNGRGRCRAPEPNEGHQRDRLGAFLDRALMVAVLLLFASSRPASSHAAADDTSAPASKEKPFASMINFALINGKAQLACDIRAPTSDDSVALVLWYKDDSLAPIYTIDARKVNSLERAKISVDDQYSSRLTFNGRSKPAQLELDQVRQDDEGDYRCRVDFKRGRTVNTVISLRVIIPPRELAIFMVRSSLDAELQDERELSTGSGNNNNNNNRSLARLPPAGLLGPLDEDSSLELVCVAYGGKPRPELTWRRDQTSLNSTSNSNFASLDKDGTSLNLRIDAIQRQHLLSIFTCQATNNNLTSPLQSSLSLDLNLRPKDVLIRQLGGHEGPLQVGQTVTFECIATGSKPPAVIHWLFQNQRHDSPMNVDHQQTSTRLSLVLQRSFNQQPLSCVATNPKIGNSQPVPTAATKQTTIKLDVNYPPQLSVQLERHQNERRLQQQQQSSDELGPSTPVAPSSDRLSDPESVNFDDTSTSSMLKNLQEGNDIYLTCRLDANPRPLKPIVWRFNGRQLASTSASATTQQQQQGTIVINNNSLVLRKVSRHQSGAYTCEATNQLGTNTSRPYELVIKHAPVCKTDDILVYEAAIGQVVAIDCQVEANPARSVHFSWFVSRGFNRSLSDWLQREATLDEQLDDMGPQLKFRVRDAQSFALIKCKAKNEIGLQQRVCLFQIVPAAGEPELGHTCSLAGSSDQSLSLQCQQNEHLKTNQLQQRSGLESKLGAANAHNKNDDDDDGDQHQQDPARNWMRNYEAMRQSLAAAATSSQSSNDNSPTGRRQLVQWPPRLRQVYPPDWLLVEVYRAPPSSQQSPNSNDHPNQPIGQNDTQHLQWSEAEHQQQQQQQPPLSGSVDYELQSYLVVSPNVQQLARVKSIVEENKLFQAKPRDIYYVATKQMDSTQTKTGRSELTQANSNRVDDGAQRDALDIDARGVQSSELTAAAHSQPWAISKEANLRLPNSFNFSVPNLEPARKYKLLIYGQNLANRTRDWLVVRGETAPGQLHETPAAAQKAVKNLVLDQADQADQATSGGGGGSSTNVSHSNGGGGKSLVMRSEMTTDRQDQPAEAPPTPLEPVRGQELDRHANARQTGGGGSSSGEINSNGELGKQLLIRIHHYKDQALAWSKQSPLLSIPVALTSCLVIVIVVIYLSSLFVSRLTRRNSGGDGGGQLPRHSTSDHFNDSSNLSSTDSTTSRASSTPLQANGVAGGGKAPAGSVLEKAACEKNHDQKSSMSRSMSMSRNKSANGHNDTQMQPNEHEPSCDQLRLQQLELSCDQSHQHSISSSGGSFNGALNIDGHYHLNHQHHLSLAWDCLDAAALDQQQQQQMLARPSWQDQLAAVTCPSEGVGQMLGSLDRRGHFHPTATIYLAPDSAASAAQTSGSELGLAAMPLVSGILQQQPIGGGWRDAHKQLVAGGSIDRRSYATLNERNGFVQLQQPQHDQYQQLFVRDQHQNELQQQQQQQQQLQRPVAKTRTRLRSSKSSVQSQHRVAFDLSNQLGQQQQQQHENDYATGELLQLTRTGRLTDSSSGSNNSTAANTADSGHESPATTGGETNSCQSNRLNRPRQRAAPVRVACQEHSFQEARGQHLSVDLNNNNNSACNCPHKQTGGQKQMQQMQLMLMEFASPSSQESNSTFLQSADSSFDTNTQQANSTPQQQQRQPDSSTPTAAYLLHHNYQMATSFVGDQVASMGQQQQQLGVRSNEQKQADSVADSNGETAASNWL